MIQLQNASLDAGGNNIFENVSCVFQQDDQVGIIGRNGAGKSTLLKVIAGHIKLSSGSVAIVKGSRIAYLPQEEILSSTLNVFDEAFSAFNNIIESEKKLDVIEEALNNGTYTDSQLEEYADLHEQLSKLDRHAAVKQTNDVLNGLGFTTEMINKSVNELSVGWKMRLALGKLLLTNADMYLFDEPTNHLDLVTQQWFLQKLLHMKQGYLLVSHDRAYLEKACNSILEIERGHATFYKGNLSKYLQEKELQTQIKLATRSRQEREISQKMETVDRFRSGTRAQQAKNIMKQIDRIELIDVEQPLPTIHFRFPTPPKPGEVVLKFKDLAYNFNEKQIFKNIEGEVHRGERVALIAANGVGKTTLLNCIIGKYSTTGSINFGHGVKFAFFEQDQARALSPNKTVFEEVCDECANVTTSEIRTLLGSFQFSGDNVHKKIRVLSGGEKNRVAMTKVLLQRANFLILDEPTNHLDLYAKDVLLQALLSYEGTILFVSHDLDFLNKLATRIIELTPSHAYSYPGSYDDFCITKESQIEQENVPTKTPEQIVNSIPSDDKKQLQKQINKLERNIEQLEKNESELTEELAKYLYGSDEYDRIYTKLLTTQKKLTQANEEWEKTVSKVK